MKTAGIAARGRPVPGLRSLRSLRPGTGRTPLFRGRKTTPKGDISELEKRGHLCFGLTVPRILYSRQEAVPFRPHRGSHPC